jgi:hypothetical protein
MVQLLKLLPLVDPMGHGDIEKYMLENSFRDFLDDVAPGTAGLFEGF